MAKIIASEGPVSQTVHGLFSSGRMRCAYDSGMSGAERAVLDWHESLSPTSVADPIVVNGPRGAGTLTPAAFAEWVERSGISLRVLSLHPVSERVVVASQEARWPSSPSWTQVATVFRVSRSGALVSAALRFPDLPSALSFAGLYVALAATEEA
jgi:hypothetical protein